MFKRLDSLSSGADHIYDDDYYIEIGSEPPRLADYRAARAKITDAFGNKTYEDVWDSVTQDESDYYLKMNLRTSQKKGINSRRKHGISINQVVVCVMIAATMDMVAITANVFQNADTTLNLEE